LSDDPLSSKVVVTVTNVVFDNNGKAADIRGNSVVYFE
jgi:hypothetical protein